MFNLIALSLIIIAIIYFLNRFLPFKVCAVCAGISGAWLLAMLGILVGLISIEEYGSAILMLMGATVVGIAYQGEKAFDFAKKSIWFWKIPATLIGLAAFYQFFLNIGWTSFFIETALIFSLAFVFFVKKDGSRKKLSEESEEIENLKQKLNGCC